MKHNHIFDTAKRIVLLAVTAVLTTTTLQAQEALHLFYRNKVHKIIELTPDTEIKFVKKPCISVVGYDINEGVLTISASAGRTFSYGEVLANDDYTISFDVPWLRARNNKLPEWRNPNRDGTVSNPFLIFAEGNKTGVNRRGTVTISIPGNQYQFVVEQMGGGLSFTPVGERYGLEPTLSTNKLIAASDTTFYVYVYPNVGVTLKSYPEWMTLVVMGSDGDKFSLDMLDQISDDVVITQEYLCTNISSAYFKFAANDSPEERTGEIVFELNGETAVCHVVQKGVEDSSSTDK